MEPVKDIITSRTNIPFLKKALDLSSFKQKLISSNIANVSTPGYKPKDIEFTKELSSCLDKTKTTGTRTNPAHIPLGQNKDKSPEVVASESANPNNVNSVDIDKEMGNLAENELIYKFGTRFMSRNFQVLKMSIKGE
ncbi:MAG: flagellar basal body rod protein FlgB [candidate division Zixibacteria bacterium]|nr:flagellar basal body rod protein FlgB [candidate division Zixibacteria bacterium]